MSEPIFYEPDAAGGRELIFVKNHPLPVFVPRPPISEIANGMVPFPIAYVAQAVQERIQEQILIQEERRRQAEEYLADHPAPESTTTEQGGQPGPDPSLARERDPPARMARMRGINQRFFGNRPVTNGHMIHRPTREQARSGSGRGLNERYFSTLRSAPTEYDMHVLQANARSTPPMPPVPRGAVPVGPSGVFVHQAWDISREPAPSWNFRRARVINGTAAGMAVMGDTDRVRSERPQEISPHIHRDFLRTLAHCYSGTSLRPEDTDEDEDEDEDEDSGEGDDDRGHEDRRRNRIRDNFIATNSSDFSAIGFYRQVQDLVRNTLSGGHLP